VERLVHIWSNRFAVSTDKLLVGLAGGFESDAIRPHVLGRFEDTLLAVMRHLTMLMLLYLGQAQSIGLRSLAGARGGGGQQRPRGFNENLAREILGWWLHTLGVRSGYTQEDVTESGCIGVRHSRAAAASAA
jgi:uncharacterized protein (DUF1800 family)